MPKKKTFFQCQECGHQAAKWLGRCPDCGAWNSMIEEAKPTKTHDAHENRSFRVPETLTNKSSKPVPLADIPTDAAERHNTGISELDRVLGGGLVPGSLVLVGGDPGIGKSTLLLQALGRLSSRQHKALYISGEESPQQVKLRSQRLGIKGENIHLLAETRADLIAQAVEREPPSVVVVDSIQTVFDPKISSAPGSVSQIREVAARFLYLAKGLQVPVFLVGHVTKGGELAGPRILEHMVDTVLYFESSHGQPFRILRAHKNRFGSTNEIGVFEMRESGLEVVQNPSELFLSERPENVPGSVVLPAIEGSRPVLVEVQALVSPSNHGNPRRTCLGFDSSRAAMLVAILERRAGLDLLGCDIFVNVAGGMKIDEPASGLAVATALASSHRNRALAKDVAVFGEIGLAGELRGVTMPESRLSEAAKLGFTRAIVPKANLNRLETPKGIEIVGVQNIEQALEAALDD